LETKKSLAGAAKTDTLSKGAVSEARRLLTHCIAYKGADTKRSIVQLLNSAVPFFLLYAVIWAGLHYGYLFALLLALPVAGFLVRLFIIQHDCGHGSFFRSRRANDMLGRAISFFTLTPYGYWRKTHAIHHASAGDLGGRGVGDVDTLTIREYRALPQHRRLLYRLYRNPLVILIIGPPYLFILRHRVPFGAPLPFRDVWRSILSHDVAILFGYGLLIALVGFKTFVLLFLPVMILATWAAGWLFYIQHQFENVQWDQSEDWNFHVAALRHSSYYSLPRILQWFTGNIGFHHIHHLCSRIPNYRLQECLETSPQLQAINRLTIRKSLKGVWLALWDEDQRKLVSFREALS
jgi:omega-6 fatty acid desaturase (delta-12 desaturase)